MDRNMVPKGSSDPAPSRRSQYRTTDSFFEPLNLSRHRGRRSADNFGRTRQRARLDENQKGSQQLGIKQPHNSIYQNIRCITIRF